jgi:hypothetical protein
VAGDKYPVRRQGEVVEEGTFRIDPTRKPRSIDVFPSKPEGKVQRGIYDWGEDGTIRICFAHPGEEDRPAILHDGGDRPHPHDRPAHRPEVTADHSPGTDPPGDDS